MLGLSRFVDVFHPKGHLVQNGSAPIGGLSGCPNLDLMAERDRTSSFGLLARRVTLALLLSSG